MRAKWLMPAASVVALWAAQGLAQPPVGGRSIRPDGPGRYVIENSLGQRKGTLVETAPGVYQMRNELGQLSDWRLKKRADGGWDYVPSPFGDQTPPR